MASTIQLWIDIHNNTNDNESVQTLAIINMLQLNWIDEKYAAKFLPKEIMIENKDINHSNAPTKTKIQSKRKLMSKKAGRDWVKHNLPLRSLFNLDDMVQRFGTYEKKTTGNVELYYFKHIDMTFFVFSAYRELVGFALCKFSR